jgi:TonB family protein
VEGIAGHHRRMKRLYVLAFALFTACAAASPRGPIVFDPDSFKKHRLQGEESVDVPEGTGARWSGVPILVTVSPQGEVTSAKFDAGEEVEGGDSAPALAAVRRWRFRPFHYRGQAVPARGTVTIRYRTPPKWRDPAAPLPPIDYSSLKISLTRSACLGSCPDYSVTIDGSGAVFFSTRSPALKGAPEAHRQFGPGGGVLLPGEHRARIDRPMLDTLIERFRAAHFFGLEGEYSTPITDGPTYALRFETGGRGWTVIDYIGRMAGMPPIVTELEDAVDKAAGTERWVTGDESSIAALRSEGFDFRSQRAAELAAYLALAGEAPDGVIVGLVEAGVSPDRPIVFDSGEAATPLGETLLVGSIGRHRPALFAYLAKRGWLARVPSERLAQAFAGGGGGCDPALARALVAGGVDPAVRIRGGERSGATALIAAVRPYGPCHGLDPKPVIDALIALGVDVNAADDSGQTVLYGVEDPDLQEQLLAAGARADVRDRKGNSPAFSSWNDRIVLGLLDAGADPKGRYFDGKTLREQALERDMPSVLAWLDAHRVD